jgi:phage terminase large subunit-like protein
MSDLELQTWELPPTNRSISELERLAYERHAQDRENATELELWFDEEAADRAVEFCERYIRHSKGRWAGRPFVLLPWEVFIVRSLFGWKRLDENGNETDARRFRFAFVQVAKKNGKSLLASAIALLLTILDNEPGAEVYSAATTQDQARIVFDEAARSIRRSPTLQRFVKVFGGRPQSRTNNISVERLAAKFEPLAADADTADGINPHGLIIDELHRWKRREFFDILLEGFGARENPLAFAITTAGAGQEGVWWEQRDYSSKVLERIVEDLEFFAFIAEPAKDADWTEEETWEQGNPSIDEVVDRKNLRKECQRAIALPSRENSFRRFKVGQLTEQIDRWIPLELWDSNGGKISEELLEGQPCFAGMDLSSTTDISTVCYWFPTLLEDGAHRLLWRAWLPEERIRTGTREDQVAYQQFVDAGVLQTTPGNVIDYAFIEAQVVADAERFEIQEFAFDPWNASSIVSRLQEVHGFTMVKVSQGVAGLSASSKEFEILLGKRKVCHGENPLARWCLSNLAIYTDAQGNIKPSKKSSGGRIDLMTAAITALARAMLTFDHASVYETRGLG